MCLLSDIQWHDLCAEFMWPPAVVFINDEYKHTGQILPLFRGYQSKVAHLRAVNEGEKKSQVGSTN